MEDEHRTMRGVVFLGDRRCTLREVPVGWPGYGEVLLRVEAAGICGSDLHVYRNSEATDQVRGHEASGVVTATGSGVVRVQVGDRVTVHHHQGCGACYECSRGETVACTIKHEVIGVHVPGAFAEYLVAQERNCIPLPPSATFADGAFLGCVGTTAYAALRRLGALPHESIAVFGLGPVGLSCVLVARALGLQVIGMDPAAHRRELALRCGAQEVVDPGVGDPTVPLRQFGRIAGTTRGDGVDCVIEASGSTAAREAILPALRREGRAAILGVSSREKVINPTDIHGRAATIIGSVVFPLAWLWDIARLCAVSGLSFAPAVTHTFPLAEAVEALHTADIGEGGKLLFRPQQQDPGGEEQP